MGQCLDEVGTIVHDRGHRGFWTSTGNLIYLKSTSANSSSREDGSGCPAPDSPVRIFSPWWLTPTEHIHFSNPKEQLLLVDSVAVTVHTLLDCARIICIANQSALLSSAS